MILKATHNKLLYAFFRLYTRLRINAAFDNVIIAGEAADRNLPVLVLANHFSWWDGFWIPYMNMKLFRRKIYFMMLEEQLRKYSFFNKTGGYSVKRGSKSVIESIHYTVSLLQDKGNMVFLFPQGKIESAYTDRIAFEKGISRIIAEISGKAQIIFMANLVEYYSSSRPSVYMYLSEYTGSADPEEISGSYNRFYSSILSEHKKKDPDK
jgi:1-acyl-sn-glycerol-3-phosphate acyltransferase